MTTAELLQAALEIEKSTHPVIVALQGKLAAVPQTPENASRLEEVAKAALPLALAFLPAGGAAAAILAAAPEVASALLQLEKLFAPLIGDAVAASRPVTPDDGVSYPVPGGNV